MQRIALDQPGERWREQDAKQQIAQEIERDVDRQSFERKRETQPFARAGIHNIRQVAETDVRELRGIDQRQKAKVPQEERKQDRTRFGPKRRPVVERLHAAAEQEIAGDRAEAGNADAKEAVAQKHAQPVPEPIGTEEGARLRIMRHMYEDDAGNQHDAHQIDPRGNVRVHSHDIRHSYLPAPFSAPFQQSRLEPASLKLGQGRG